MNRFSLPKQPTKYERPKGSLVNDLYVWGRVYYHVQADNGKELILLRSELRRGKPVVADKAEFELDIVRGDLSLVRTGTYNFHRYTFAEWMDKHKLYWQYNKTKRYGVAA